MKGDLSERQPTDQVSALPVCDELAATCTAALLHTLVAKKVPVARRPAQELARAGLLKAFCDGFACLLHEKLGKEEENTAIAPACKGEKEFFFWKPPAPTRPSLQILHFRLFLKTLHISEIELFFSPHSTQSITAHSTVQTSSNQSRIVGTAGGRIRRLGGFQKHHRVPDSHGDATQSFVRKAGHSDVKSAADALYRDIRETFAYKRRDFDYTCEDGFAWIKTPDFDLHLRVDQCEDDPKNYRFATEIVALHSDEIIADPRFHACFTHHCDQLVIDFTVPVRVEDKIDRIEDMPDLRDALTYEPDGSSFELRLPQLDLDIHVTETTMTFRLLTLRNLGKLLDHSQKAFDILADCQFGLRLR